jgi:hypothetical protein
MDGGSSGATAEAKSLVPKNRSEQWLCAMRTNEPDAEQGPCHTAHADDGEEQRDLSVFGVEAG